VVVVVVCLFVFFAFMVCFPFLSVVFSACAAWCACGVVVVVCVPLACPT